MKSAPRLAAACALLAASFVATPARADDGIATEYADDGRRIGTATTEWYWWGPCRVREFDGGSWGRYLRVADGPHAPSFRVAHATYRGYAAAGGPGGVGCARSAEFAWRGGVRQNFSNGQYMFWRDGMSRSVPAFDGPVRWAFDRLGERAGPTETGRWSGYCLRFAYYAHGRSSVPHSAATHWDDSVRNGRANRDANIPYGAIVHYAVGEYGHAGVHVGDGWVVSTEGDLSQDLPVRMHRYDGVYTYLGWVWPY